MSGQDLVQLVSYLEGKFRFETMICSCYQKDTQYVESCVCTCYVIVQGHIISRLISSLMNSKKDFKTRNVQMYQGRNKGALSIEIQIVLKCKQWPIYVKIYLEDQQLVHILRRGHLSIIHFLTWNVKIAWWKHVLYFLAWILIPGIACLFETIVMIFFFWKRFEFVTSQL